MAPHFKPSIPYPVNEQPKIEALENLFQEWHCHFASHGAAELKAAANDMVWDGFYPHYFGQRRRLLFVGRESRDIGGDHNMNVLFKAYRESKRIGGRHIDSDKFHSRMIHISHGIINGMLPWQEIPCASEIVETFGEKGGLSFAFMNISKLTNDNCHFASKWATINAAYNHSVRGRNFIREEILILEPEIIITMNLGDKIHSLGDLAEVHESENAEVYEMKCGERKSLLINTWHFSWWGRNDVDGFYHPILEAIRRHGGFLKSRCKQ